jgi:hypothetical protein
MGDTEVAGQSPADDEQQTPEAEANQAPDPKEEPSAPDVGDAGPAVEPASKYEG